MERTIFVICSKDKACHEAFVDGICVYASISQHFRVASRPRLLSAVVLEYSTPVVHEIDNIRNIQRSFVDCSEALLVPKLHELFQRTGQPSSSILLRLFFLVDGNDETDYAAILQATLEAKVSATKIRLVAKTSDAAPEHEFRLEKESVKVAFHHLAMLNMNLGLAKAEGTQMSWLFNLLEDPPLWIDARILLGHGGIRLWDPDCFDCLVFPLHLQPIDAGEYKRAAERAVLLPSTMALAENETVGYFRSRCRGFEFVLHIQENSIELRRLEDAGTSAGRPNNPFSSLGFEPKVSLPTVLGDARFPMLLELYNVFIGLASCYPVEENVVASFQPLLEVIIDCANRNEPSMFPPFFDDPRICSKLYAKLVKELKTFKIPEHHSQLAKIVQSAVAKYSPSEPEIPAKKPRVQEQVEAIEDNEFKVLVPYQNLVIPDKPAPAPFISRSGRSLYDIYWSIQLAKVDEQLERKKYWE